MPKLVNSLQKFFKEHSPQTSFSNDCACAKGGGLCVFYSRLSGGLNVSLWG